MLMWRPDRGSVAASARKGEGQDAHAMETRYLSRRALMSLAVALLGHSSAARAQAPSPEGEPAPLKSAAGGPLGCCATAALLRDPEFSRLFLRHYSQISPEFEMKMNVIMGPDRRLRFQAADALVAFARQHGLRLHATTLVWYKHEPPAMQALDGSGEGFARAYDSYIAAVVGRYRGRAASWDVVNEPATHEGDGLRHSLWSRNLGEDGYIERAFAVAAEADPGAVHFINEYDLEARPNKRLVFMRLVERLLKRGARIGGIGTQTHVKIDLPRGAAMAAMKDLASFGLPIHVSEFDVSFGRRVPDPRPVADKRALQLRVCSEIVEAYLALPASQRFAFTVWGLRDRDSWLRLPPMAGDGSDEPLPFGDDGRAKPLFHELARSFAAARPRQ